VRGCVKIFNLKKKFCPVSDPDLDLNPGFESGFESGSETYSQPDPELDPSFCFGSATLPAIKFSAL